VFDFRYHAVSLAAVLVAVALTNNPWPLAAAALAILGHVFPVWTHFKGGKGVAVGAGAMIGLVPSASGVLLVLWILLVVFTRYVSVASIVAALAACAWLLANLEGSTIYIICGPIFAVLPILMLPIALAAFSLVDPSGRMAGTFPSFMTFAAAFAPFIGGSVKDHLGGTPAVGWVAVACILVGGVLLGQLAVQADRIRRQQIAFA